MTIMTQSHFASADERIIEPMGQANAIRSSLHSICLIGKDSRGNWVVQGPEEKYGGLFVNRAEALKFAMFENGHARGRDGARQPRTEHDAGGVKWSA